MRFAKFFTVGVFNTLLTLVVFNVLVLAGLPAWGSNALAYAVGTVNSFFWNRRWTYGDRQGLDARRTFWKFALVIAGSLVLTTAVVAVLEALIGRFEIDEIVPRIVAINVAEGIAVLLGMVWNYSLVTYWAFAERPASALDADAQPDER